MIKPIFRAELKRSLLQQNLVKNEEVLLAKNKPIFHFNSFPRFMLSLKAIRLQVILAKDMSSWYLGKIIRHNPICPTFLPQDILSKIHHLSFMTILLNSHVKSSLLCCLPKPLSGSLRILESEIPITSIDLVLHRVENTTELTKIQKSEVTA